MSDSSSESSSSSSEDDKKKKKKKKKDKKVVVEKCKWLSPHSACLLDTMHEQKAEGQQSESGWKDTVWPVCAARLQEKFPNALGGPKTAPKCQDHFTNLKGDFKVVKELRGRSGMGWDGVTCTVTAAPDVWDKACKANSKFKKWRKKPFPLFDTMADLIGEVVATGEGVLVLSKAAGKDGKAKDGDAKVPKVKVDQEGERKKRHRSRTGSEPDTSVVELDESSDDQVERQMPAQKRQKTSTGGRRPSGAAAVQGVSGSLDRLGDTLADVLGTRAADAADAKVAKRRSEAIVTVSNMTGLAIAQRAAAICLFANPTTVELLLEIPDEELRVAFVEELLRAEGLKTRPSA